MSCAILFFFSSLRAGFTNNRIGREASLLEPFFFMYYFRLCGAILYYCVCIYPPAHDVSHIFILQLVFFFSSNNNILFAAAAIYNSKINTTIYS